MPSPFIIGLSKIAFGFLVGVVGVWLASRLFNWLIGTRRPDDAIDKGNLGVAVLKGSGLVALGILCRNAVESSFAALDYLGLAGESSWGLLGEVALHSLLHTVLALGTGSCVLAAGTMLFDKLTGGVEEIEQIRAGNVAPAIVVGAVLIVLALLTAPGLETALEGLLPVPELPEDVFPTPR
jgi:uncharacterized membrane protein YjfL (UPF0719 family)